MAKLLADWIFTPEHVLRGGIDAPELELRDATGQGNDLRMRVWGKPGACALRWNGAGRAMVFCGRKADGGGKYFSTVPGAPVNGLRFENGYTILAELKLPAPGTFDPWMGIVTRQGSGAQLGRTEGETEILCTLSFNDSFQWTWYPLGEARNATCWSCCADELLLDDFVCVAVRSDGSRTRLFLNGVTDIRNPSAGLRGIECVPGLGWNIGAALWGNEIDSFFSGELRRVRIYDGDTAELDPAYQKRLFRIEGTNAPLPLADGGDTVAILPDTQYMGQYRPEMVEEMVRFTVRERGALHVRALLHVGDVSEESSVEQFEAASRAFSPADEAGMPYLVTPGNHDCRDGAERFARVFGAARYAARPGVLFDADTLSGAMEFVLCGRSCLAVAVNSYRAQASCEWAGRVIRERGLPVIVFTHDVFEPAGTAGVRLSETGALVWERVAGPLDEVFLVIGGHHFGVGHGIGRNDAGKPVLELLVNYQAYPNGGNGWLQLVEFDEAGGCVRVRTVSPWVEQLPERGCYDFARLTGPRDEFALPFDFARLGGAAR